MNNLNFLSKITFYLKRPKVVIVTGEGRACAGEAIRKVLEQVKNEILVVEAELQQLDDLEFLVKNSSLPILVVTQIGDIPFDKDFFAGDRGKTIEIRKLTKKTCKKVKIVQNRVEIVIFLRVCPESL